MRGPVREPSLRTRTGRTGHDTADTTAWHTDEHPGRYAGTGRSNAERRTRVGGRSVNACGEHVQGVGRRVETGGQAERVAPDRHRESRPGCSRSPGSQLTTEAVGSWVHNPSDNKEIDMANSPREQVYEYVADLANGADVWCDWADKPARTADGFCQFCGSTKHRPARGPVAVDSETIDGDPGSRVRLSFNILAF